MIAYLLHSHDYRFLAHQVAAVRKYLPEADVIYCAQGPFRRENRFDSRVKLSVAGAAMLGIETLEITECHHLPSTFRWPQLYNACLGHRPTERRIVLQGDCLPAEPMTFDQLTGACAVAGRGVVWKEQTLLEWTWLAADGPFEARMGHLEDRIKLWPASVYNSELHIERCEPGFLHFDRISKRIKADEKMEIVRAIFGNADAVEIETAIPRFGPKASVSLPITPSAPPTPEEETEAIRREAICRACPKWDTEKDGCGLLKKCERHELTRIMWLREKATCRLGRWLRPGETAVESSETTPTTSPALHALPSRTPCPSCDIPEPSIHSESDIWQAVRDIINGSSEPPAFNSPMGVVTCGEGKYALGIKIMATILRKELKCDLPVKIFHRGPWHLDMAGLDVELIDTEKLQSSHPATKYGGWQSKDYGVVHSGFERVLFLDADAYCVADPTPLFSLLDEHRYVLWADFGPGAACGDIPNPLPYHQNGGEYLVNLRTFWREYLAIRFLSNHGFCSRDATSHAFRRRGLGDECTTRLVRSIIQDEGVFKADWVDRTRGVGVLCRYPAYGSVYIAHRMRRESKLFPDTVPRSSAKWPMEALVMKLFEENSPQFQAMKEAERIERLPASRRAARHAVLGIKRKI